MQKIYRIHLSAEERDSLTALTTSSKPISAKKVIKAQALLPAGESDAAPSLSDVEIMKATGMKLATLVRLRQRVCEAGPITVLDRKPQARPSREKIVDGEVEAQLAQIACSSAPDGRNRWSLRLIADRLVELEIVDSISHETIHAIRPNPRAGLRHQILRVRHLRIPSLEAAPDPDGPTTGSARVDVGATSDGDLAPLDDEFARAPRSAREIDATAHFHEVRSGDPDISPSTRIMPSTFA